MKLSRKAKVLKGQIIKMKKKIMSSNKVWIDFVILFMLEIYSLRIFRSKDFPSLFQKMVLTSSMV